MNESLILKIHVNWRKGFSSLWLTSLFTLFCWGFRIYWNVFFFHFLFVRFYPFLSVNLLFDSPTNTLFFFLFHLFPSPFSVHFFLWISYFHFHLNLYLSILFLSTLTHSINHPIEYFLFYAQQRFLRTLNSPMFPKEPKEFVFTYYLTTKVQNISPIS